MRTMRILSSALRTVPPSLFFVLKNPFHGMGHGPHWTTCRTMPHMPPKLSTSYEPLCRIDVP